jgi:glyoxylase-like metal-dependent hydrolase (beta-lactamase superfamily II)
VGHLIKQEADMKIVIILLILIYFVGNSFSQSFESEHFTIEKLTNGVYAAIHKNGGYAISNAGIINLGNETLVFDCFLSPKAARDLKKAAEELTGNDVKYVINSHFHNDHIRGNQVFSGAEIIATQKTKELIEETEPEELEYEKKVVDDRIKSAQQEIDGETDPRKLEEHKMWLGYYKAIKESFGEYKTRLPDKIITDTLVINGKDRSVILFSRGKGHTESDMVLLLPEDKILFAGDLLFIENHPWLGDGFIEEWIEYLGELKKLNVEQIVPGHGPVGKNRNLDEMISYIQTITNLVDDAIANNLSKEDLRLTTIPDEFKDWWLSRFFTLNLIVQYGKKSN